MKLSDIFDSKSVAVNRTEVENSKDPFLGELFFPPRKKMGIDLKWIKIHKGLGVALKPSNFDAMPTIRTREGIAMTKEEMPFFRESMLVKEQDMMEVMRIRESDDPYINEVLESIYDDTNNLIDGADISVERMRMQLLAPTGGALGIKIGTVDNMIHTYDYDPDGSWKAKHYAELSTSGDKWTAPTTAKPLNDLKKGIQYLASVGVTARYILSNSNTFDLMSDCDQVKDSLVSITGAIGFLDDDTVGNLVKRKLKVDWLTYDKMFKDYDGTETKFYPDNYVTIIGSGELGATYYGTTPEERTLLGNANVDVSVLERGVAIAVKTDYGPPTQVSTTASQIVLPSFEGMDSIFVIKVA